MSTSPERIAFLVESWSSLKATEAERQELLTLIDSGEGEDVLQQHIRQLVEGFNKNELLPTVDWENSYNQIMRKIGNEQVAFSPKPVVRRITAWKRWAVAASIIITLGAGSYIFFSNKPGKQDNIAKTIIPVPHEIQAPGTSRAMITLSNGQQLYLDSAANGQLLQQAGIEIVKLADGKIAYRGTTTETIYNTLSNPRGSKAIDMALSDGSHVWLNAGSSVTFPLAFIGKERNVSITGEAYFEIAHDAGRPFFVNKGDLQVQVLGTHFNVNAYDDEADIKVTLLEGSVKIISGNKTGLLRPGQQAQVTNEVKVLSNVDLEQVMAWKEGVFRFKNTNIGEIMREMARWYDVQVEYKGNYADLNFEGSVSRQANVSQVLTLLEATDAVRFKVEGRKIVVMP